MSSRPGRNEACPCGSGKKYKQCCLRRDDAEQVRRVAARGGSDPAWSAELRPDVDEAVDQVMQRLESGAGVRCKAQLESLMAQYPRYHTVNFAMGVYEAMVGNNPDVAIRYFEQAVATFPPFAEAHYNLGLAARKIADIPRAVGAFRAAVRYSSAGDGIADMARKELEFLKRVVLKTSPFHSLDAFVANARLFDEAFQCLNSRQFARALELFEKVLIDYPGHVQSYGNMALANAALGRRSAALACFDRALELDPGYKPARQNRAMVEQMREGEPFVPDALAEVRFYRDRFEKQDRNP